jgi:ABC-type multidrug transport system permease subunit
VQTNPIAQLTLAKMREMLRTPEAIFWVFVFPLILALVLGIAFRARGPEVVLPVGVLEGVGAQDAAQVLDGADELTAEVFSEADARRALWSGKVTLVVVPGEAVTYWYDPKRQDSRLARSIVDEALQEDAGRVNPLAVERREVKEKGSRYIDFLIPGLMGMNIMGTGLWGVGFAVVVARSRKLLKRLVATPMRRQHYLLAQILGRMIFLVPEVGAVLLFARFVFDVPIRGSLVAVVAVTLLGAMTFAGIGLLTASRTRTIEGISGLMNVVMLPMWVLSGIFFSTERFPAVMQPVVQALPLTALNDALRALMIDGATLASQAGEIAITAAWGVAAFLAALRIFRWS